MSTLYVRGVPEDLYVRLRQEAAEARRSIGAQTIEVLRRALAPAVGLALEDLLLRADAIRARAAEVEAMPTAAELIREDRDR